MSHFIEYDLEDGSSILVEAPEDLNIDDENSGIEEVSIGGKVIIKSTKTFNDALSSVKKSFIKFNSQFQDLDVDELELTASIKMTGEASFGLGALGAEGTMQIKLKWNKKKQA